MRRLRFSVKSATSAAVGSAVRPKLLWKGGSAGCTLLLCVCSSAAVLWPIGCGTANEEGIVEEKACVDFWTAVHFGAGYYLGERLGEDSFPATGAILIGYEVVEPHFWPGFGENRLNQDCDILWGLAGWFASAFKDPG